MASVLKQHPTLGIAVRSNGEIYVPTNGPKKAHWTFGCKDKDGYLVVTIKGKNYRAHRLVAEAFIPNPENKKEIDHIDRCPAHNNVENLRWVTRSENNRNRRDNDLVEARCGTHCYEDYKKFCKERDSNYRKTHKCVSFSNGKKRWLPNSEAIELLKLPVKDRVYGK